MKTSIFIFLLLISSMAIAQNPLPVANQGIIKYCDENMGKKIGRGECWDLASYALGSIKAEWKSPYVFGKEYDPKTDTMLAGDILQFEDVKFESKNGWMSFPHHTAIIYEVIDNTKIVLVHQNHNRSKVVQTSELNLAEKTKGSIKFYHPQLK